MPLILVVAAILLLVMNAFFVLAEFAMVKVRPSRIEELADDGSRRARLVAHIQSHLDEYLSVSQLGITFASIGLGFVGELAIARMIGSEPGVSPARAHSIAFAVAYLLVSSFHIVLGELVPKNLAIRKAEGVALLTALPLRVLHALFYIPLVVLNGATRVILWLLGFSRKVNEKEHSEDELKILLARSQDTGLMSFDRLLLLENVFDLGDLKVKDVMRPTNTVKILRAGAAWADNFELIRQSRFSRYPILSLKEGNPIGIVHVKDLLLEGPDSLAGLDLARIARPFYKALEEMSLEKLLRDLRQKRGQIALVYNAAGRWTGLVSLEDVLEEIVGPIEDEFETEPPTYLLDALTPGRVLLGLKVGGLEDLISRIFEQVPQAELPKPRQALLQAVLDRERAMSTHLGHGLAIPHARLEGLDKPLIILGRSEPEPLAEGDSGVAEEPYLVFVLLTPAGSPRTQVRLLARLARLFQSEYVADHLRAAKTPDEVIEIIRASEPIAV